MPDKVTKFINSLDSKTRAQLKKKLRFLRQNPFGMKGVKKLQELGDNIYRLRMGKIRIVYKIFENIVEIIDIDYRGNIY